MGKAKRKSEASAAKNAPLQDTGEKMSDCQHDPDKFSTTPPTISPVSAQGEIADPFQTDSFRPERPAKRLKYSTFANDGATLGNQRQELTADKTTTYTASYDKIGDNSSILADQDTTEDDDMEEDDVQSIADNISLEGERVGSPKEDHEKLLTRAQKLELIVQLYQQKEEKAAAKLIQSQDELEKTIKDFDNLTFTHTKLTQDLQFMNQRIAKAKDSEQLQRELDIIMDENIFLKLQVEAIKAEKQESVRCVAILEQELVVLKSELRGRSLTSTELTKETGGTSESMQGLEIGDSTRHSVEYSNGPLSTRRYRSQRRALSFGKKTQAFKDWHEDVKMMTREEKDEELAKLERKVRIVQLLNGPRDVVTPAFR